MDNTNSHFISPCQLHLTDMLRNQLHHGSHPTVVVVILGWLGAQQKSIHRYEDLYRNLLGGTTVVKTHIAPPFTVVQTVVTEPIGQLTSPSVPLGWPNVACHDNVRSIQDVAWNALKDVHNVQNCSHFYVHAFSNGGCFVWEEIRQILSSNDNYDESTDHEEQPPLSVRNVISKLRHQLKGVVFDSCPIADLYRLPDALQYCSIIERIKVLRYCGYEYLTILTNEKVKQRVQQRIDKYVDGLQTDPFPIPQLYLYGRDDPLAPASFIDEMIQIRRNVANEQMIMSCVWEKSRHCGHYIQHPKEYAGAITKFLNYSSNNNNVVVDHINVVTLRSKL